MAICLLRIHKKAFINNKKSVLNESWSSEVLFIPFPSCDHCSTGLLSKNNSKLPICRWTPKQFLKRKNEETKKLDVRTRCRYEMITTSESDLTTRLSRSTVPSFVSLCFNGKAFCFVFIYIKKYKLRVKMKTTTERHYGTYLQSKHASEQSISNSQK